MYNNYRAHRYLHGASKRVGDTYTVYSGNYGFIHRRYDILVDTGMILYLRSYNTSRSTRASIRRFANDLSLLERLQYFYTFWITEKPTFVESSIEFSSIMPQRHFFINTYVKNWILQMPINRLKNCKILYQKQMYLKKIPIRTVVKSFKFYTFCTPHLFWISYSNVKPWVHNSIQFQSALFN